MPLKALHDDITAFRQYLKAERGLAINTLLAYTRDLDHFAEWYAACKQKDHAQLGLAHFSQYVSHLRDVCHLAPPSIARHLVALKMFFRFLKLEGRASNTAVDLLSSPTRRVGDDQRRCQPGPGLYRSYLRGASNRQKY